MKKCLKIFVKKYHDLVKILNLPIKQKCEKYTLCPYLLRSTKEILSRFKLFSVKYKTGSRKMPTVHHLSYQVRMLQVCHLSLFFALQDVNNSDGRESFNCYSVLYS